MTDAKRFGHLAVLGTFRDGGRLKATCQCDCGSVKTIRMDALVSGATVSCGCHSAKQTTDRNTTHGMSKTLAYSSWHCMMNRCYRPDHEAFAQYGGRGITVCDRWHTFENFVQDMGEPTAGQQIDRKDFNGNYEPGNCRWASSKENANNRSNSKHLTLNGRTQTIAEWAREAGVNYVTFFSRLRRGWSLSDALKSKGKSCS